VIIAAEKLRDYVLNFSNPDGESKARYLAEIGYEQDDWQKLEIMTFPLFSRVILTRNLPAENLFAGDMGTIVEHHPATKEYPEGYEVEFFAGNSETVAVVSVPATALRAATGQEVLHVRQLEAA
jgi:hypothetical protein